ncbi:cytochrome-c oxidase [Alkalibacillus aidingensis]|uniref:cytochrome-c oxidase n=1 Tax=Alkalibacillus aidingensis TaxID=2747607 RepID=UPI0016612843|nr:cytochrome-c oxidase [Alkalibacillus aidingensis]
MGVKLIKISVIYFVIGVSLGLYMSITSQYHFTGVHVHVNLLGWTSMTLAGILYLMFPKAGMSVLGKIHFWIHNISLPVMMIGLFFLILGHTALFPFVALGGVFIVIAVILFAINILIYVRQPEQENEV